MFSFVSAGEVSSASQPNRATDFKLNSELAPNIPSDEDIPSDAEDTDDKSPHRLSLSELNGPFLLNQVAKENAAARQEKLDDDSEPLSSLDKEDAPSSKAKIRYQPKPVTSLHNGTVSPMRERLLADGRNGTDFLSAEPESSRQEFAKLWWVNLWIQQMPLNDQDDLDTYEEISNSEENARDEPSENVSPPKEDRLEEKAAENELLVEQNFTEQKHTQYDELHNFDVNTTGTRRKSDDENTADSARRNGVRMENPRALEETAFISSGMWAVIDNAMTFGLASKHRELRLSRRLRSTRKLFSRLTGFHGLLSGKSYYESRNLGPSSTFRGKKMAPSRYQDTVTRNNPDDRLYSDNEEASNDAMNEEEKKRLERVKTIDRLIAEGQERLQQLICEKDVLQRRPNPLFQYSTQSTQVSELTEDKVQASGSSINQTTSRQFKFPPDDLVDEYLEMIFWSRRVTKMNHTHLWKDTDLQEDDERIVEDFLAPTKQKGSNKYPRSRTKHGGSGNWLLRQSIGKGPSLGEKIGESMERAAYKAVAGAVMSALARALSGLHGLNVLENADISLMLEQSPDLPDIPPMDATPSDYAHDALKKVFRTKSRHRKKRHKQRSADREYIQKDAVTEMLLSQAQISAPLLQFFPQAWQRALLGNIITLSTAVISDFFDGLKFQILGYQLSFSFKPITQEDMINHLGFARANDRSGKLADFEAAVKATAQDIADELKFLDRWHERALGSGILRTQIANLIARVVLALVDDILRDSRMNLWSAHAGGPRIIAGLEYRTQASNATRHLEKE
ncbi:unnamed protein product [Cylindrotheca closterium]|uniref:Uncharacterized protein n=1 Tax=Cylindrotheca closterium TaxID=2856 RepID=A0AAD2FFG5_9STRA|nr:unnamed protein product [Cylindrotheca closterium]